MAGMPSVAVLPFINIGDDPEQTYFAEGLTEDVVTDLSQLSGLLTVVHRGARDGKERPSPQEAARSLRSEEHTSELQSLMRISYAVFCLTKKKDSRQQEHH